METINVHSKRNNYQVIVGDCLENLLFDFFKNETRYFVVIDSKLEGAYKNIILHNAQEVIFYVIEGGENAKSISSYQKLTEELLKYNISKNDFIIAIGGGSILDLVGFTATTYKRGVKFAYIPTTTLGMVDACVGGKNAINVGETKNVLGTINPPEVVIIGLDCLRSLTKKDYMNGLYEALKMGITLDKSLYEIFLNDDIDANIEKIIIKSINAKSNIVMQDEDDLSFRKILNFGHTFGHALESATDFTLSHGEAVANGMLIASKNAPYYENLLKILNKMDCTILDAIDKNAVMNFIKNDKKSKGKTIDFIVVNDIEDAEIVEKTFEELWEMM